MGKKQVAVSLRKPPPTDPDAFVGGAAHGELGAPVVARLTPQAVLEGPTMTTRVGERREVTIYLPVELSRRLSVRCLELDRDVSNLVAEALVGVLEPREDAPEAGGGARDVWDRARAVLTELRARLPHRLSFF